jgi:hypothetical protein
MAIWPPPPPRRPAAATAPTAGVEQAPADNREEQDSEQQPHQPDVQPHVAIQDVAELVGNDALQFITVQPLQCAPGHTDRGVIDREPRREGVDALLLVEHVDGGYRCA